jgi:hypothetical protein
MTMGLFEGTNITRITMARHVKEFPSSYTFLDKLIAYVKDESGNLSTLHELSFLWLNVFLWHLHFHNKNHFLAMFSSKHAKCLQ